MFATLHWSMVATSIFFLSSNGFHMCRCAVEDDPWSNCLWSHIAIVASLCCWVWDQNVCPFTDKRLPGGGSGAGKVPNNANLAPGCNRLAQQSRGRGQANAAGRKAEARENHGRLRKSAQYKNKTKSPYLNENVQNLWSWEKEKRNTFLLPMNEKGVCGYNFN